MFSWHVDLNEGLRQNSQKKLETQGKKRTDKQGLNLIGGSQLSSLKQTARQNEKGSSGGKFNLAWLGM